MHDLVLNQAPNNHLDFVRSDLPSWSGSGSHGELSSMCRSKQIFPWVEFHLAEFEALALDTCLRA